jgi:hypothetical protein
MEKEFIPYEQALSLKELGFDESCFGHWNYNNREYQSWCGEKDLEKERTNKWIINVEEEFPKINKGGCTAPLYQQAFRWFRKEYNLHAEPYTVDMGAIEYCFHIRDLYSEKYVYDNFVGAGGSYHGTFSTPEDSEIECLKKLIEIVKEQK